MPHSIIHPPKTPQQQASQPTLNVWVSASAGSGKTKVLVDRLLRLILAGADPAKLLCLTFTKNAAQEMRERLMLRLEAWATQSVEALTEELYALSGEPPTLAMITLAPTLLRRVQEALPGLSIQTVHSFCQGLVQRFAVEAGAPLEFDVLDSTEQHHILTTLVDEILLNPGAAGLSEPLEVLAQYISEFSFQGILESCIQHRQKIEALWATYPSLDACLAAHKSFIMPTTTVTKVDLLTLAQDVADLTIHQWDDLPPALCTQSGTVRAKLKRFVGTDTPMGRLIAEFIAYQNQEASHKIWRITEALHKVAIYLFKRYQSHKYESTVVDFDDVLTLCRRLITDPTTRGLVLHHTAQTIDHILMDEAQDTNPLQWSLVCTLIEELLPAHPTMTFFIVGDGKQSIYSFQGADHHLFAWHHDYLESLCQNVQRPFMTLSLDVSFRSLPGVLHAVDGVMNTLKAPYAAAPAPLCHTPHRHYDSDHHSLLMPSSAVCWPLITKQNEGEEKDSTAHQERRLAQHISQEVAAWLTAECHVPATGMAIRPYDILLLVRRRGGLVAALIQEFTRLGIPIMGQDRLVLGDHLITHDLLALFQWILEPYDTFALACVLKGPLCQWDDATIALHLNPLTHTPLSVPQVLEDIRAQAERLAPYELLALALRTMVPSPQGPPVEMLVDLSVRPQFSKIGRSSLMAFTAHLKASLTQSCALPQGARDQVQIMTIHGAKGLQAPVVIMADASCVPRGRDPWLWGGDHQGRRYGFITASQSQLPSVLIPFKEATQLALHQEYYRLLYVGMTRAQDSLYIAGYEPAQTYSTSCTSWYHVAHQVLPSLPWSGEDELTPTRHHKKILAPDTHKLSARCDGEGMTDFPPAPTESPNPLRPITGGGEGTMFLWTKEDHPNTIYGQYSHKILESAPFHSKAALATLAQTMGPLYPGVQPAQVIDDLWRLHQDPEIAYLLSLPSLVEHPVAGYVEGLPYKGRIDRLCWDADHLYIIDYKTSLKGLHGGNLPTGYAMQLQRYTTILAPIFPHLRPKPVIITVHPPGIVWLNINQGICENL